MRLFYANPYDLWHIINYFPERFEFLFGKALLMDIVSLKPGPDVSFDGWMYQIIYNTDDIAGTNASVGELWADWFILAFFIIFLWGIFIGSWDKIYVTIKLNSVEKFIFTVQSLLLGLSAANLYKAILVLSMPFLIFLFFYRFFCQMLKYIL